MNDIALDRASGIPLARQVAGTLRDRILTGAWAPGTEVPSTRVLAGTLGISRTLVVEAYDRAQASKLATGTLLTLDNQIDTSTGTVKLKAQFDNGDDALFPNQFVNTRLLVDTKHHVVLLPNTVIQRNTQGGYVYLVKPDETVAVQAITVGVTDGNESEVEGLNPGDAVAADNFSRLTDGAKIVDEEQFGPILPVIRFDDIDDVIARANASDYGLGGSVWSKDIAKAASLATRIAAGQVWVNQHIGIGPHIPMAGFKQSGLGAEQSVEGLAEYAQLQVINIKR